MTEAYDPTKLNVLVAYPYATPPKLKRLAEFKDSVRFVLDSGAFTAWKAGKPIELDDYCRFLEGLPVKPWRYFLLDVIGDPHGTMRNYETMLKRGFTPVPIFTRGEDPSVLEDYYKTSDVVGIGGLVGTRRNKGFVNGIMKHVGGRKVHWLGFTVPEFVLHYRPYMCDSSSFDSLTELLGPGFEKKSVWLQPVSQGDEATELCMEACFRNRWRLSLQTHKYAGLR